VTTSPALSPPVRIPSPDATAALTWLGPLRQGLAPTDQIDWSRLEHLAMALDAAVMAYPVGADVQAGPERSIRLRAIRRNLASLGYADTTDQHPIFGMFAQFVCGYQNIDLRDAIGLGHGRLIARHATPATRERWLPRLLAGDLAGIAITEPHGGSRPAETRVHAVRAPDGTWLVSGRKIWISRLVEAAVFVVFFRHPDGQLAAAAIDATAPGLRRTVIPPTGLAGWTWGILDLDAVPVGPEDVLAGDGMLLLRDHFAHYRPLVTATAVGGAAAVFDAVATTLTHRRDSGDLPRLRDSAVITLGRTHAQLVTGLLGACMASRLANAGHHAAEQWSAATKAHGVDVAHGAVAELALLLGAAGFRADSPIAKTHRDLNGLLYADGIHDSLYRAAGKHHITACEAPVPEPRTA
jgi:alkylation response protein AidB-like acyl-CoA dehydrogenase